MNIHVNIHLNVHLKFHLNIHMNIQVNIRLKMALHSFRTNVFYNRDVYRAGQMYGSFTSNLLSIFEDSPDEGGPP